MAKQHKIFIKEEGIRTIPVSRKELEAKALSLWLDYAEEYRTLIYDYIFCFQEKRERGLRHRILPVAIVDYPLLPLLRQETYDCMIKFINRLTEDELRHIVTQTEYVVKNDKVLLSLREWVRETKYLLESEKITSLTPPVRADSIAVPWA